MMEINFSIPDKYIKRIKDAFEITTEEEFKEKIKNIVKDTVKLFEEEKAINEAKKTIVVEEDLIT